MPPKPKSPAPVTIDTTTIAPIILLAGDDAIGREAARRKISAALKERSSPVSESIYDSASEDLAAFLDRRMTFSLFQEVRLFQLRHVDSLSENELKEITAALAADIADTYWIIEADCIGRKDGDVPARFVSWMTGYKSRAKKNPERLVWYEFPRPRDYEISGWLMSNVPVFFDRAIGKKEADLLIDLAGTDLTTLYAELQKIDLHLPAKKAITQDAIEEITGASRVASAYELAGALGTKNLPRVLELLDALFRESFSAPACISAIFRHFWALFRIRQWGKANRQEMQAFLGTMRNYNKPVQDEIGLKIGVAAGILRENQANRVYPAVIKSGIIDQARAFSDDDLRAIIRILHEIDLDLKTGRADATKETMQHLAYRIVRVEAVEQVSGRA
jgi:DNA polymerase III delta subunit